MNLNMSAAGELMMRKFASLFLLCASGAWATRLRIPREGTENDDANAPHVATRHIFDLGVGTGNLFRREKKRVKARFTVL